MPLIYLYTLAPFCEFAFPYHSVYVTKIIHLRNFNNQMGLHPDLYIVLLASSYDNSFCFVVNSLFIGTSKCTYGPSYWCANFANAKECSATQHCLKSYWRSIIPHLTNKVMTLPQPLYPLVL